MRIKFLQTSFVVVLAAMLLTLAGESAAADSAQYKITDGIAIYLGVIPAEIVRGHPKQHPEGAMHGGAPSGERDHHVMIAVFDSATGKRIANAKVTARVGELGHLGESEKKLEPMAIAGTTTYGNFFRLTGSGPYRVQVEIRRPGIEQPTKAEFEFKHP